MWEKVEIVLLAYGSSAIVPLVKSKPCKVHSLKLFKQKNLFSCDFSAGFGGSLCGKRCHSGSQILSFRLDNGTESDSVNLCPVLCEFHLGKICS